MRGVTLGDPGQDSKSSSSSSTGDDERCDESRSVRHPSSGVGRNDATRVPVPTLVFPLTVLFWVSTLLWFSTVLFLSTFLFLYDTERDISFNKTTFPKQYYAKART